MLTPAQIKKLEKLAKVGDIAIASELNALESKIEALETIVPALREAKDGYTPVKGVDYEDGSDYVLTEQDKREIAKSITVPVIEKVIERTEVIKEVPIVTNKITNQIVKEITEKEVEVAVLDESTVAYLEDEIKKAQLDTEEFNRALGIVDQRTSFLINKVNNLPTATIIPVSTTAPSNPSVGQLWVDIS